MNIKAAAEGIKESVRSDFAARHIGPNQYDIDLMLAALNESDLTDFIAKVVPRQIQTNSVLGQTLPTALSEVEALAEIKALAQKNQVARSYIGCGYYGTLLPNVILRNILENPGWYTAYTPYQPEISQGRLEALFAFQTAVTDLTGMAVANASMLDEATAGAEAMTLARRNSKVGDDAVFLVDRNLHPQIKAVIATRATPIGVVLQEFNPKDFDAIATPYFGVIVAQFPSEGGVADLSELAKSAKSQGAIAILATDLLGATLYQSAGEQGFDVAIGSAQRFGVPMGFGGPHAGFMAVRAGLERSIPGRLVGQSLDAHGNPALRLALQTREQHIRREKATSNICTAQVLLAVISAFYAMYHGPAGLRQIATQVRNRANDLRAALARAGWLVGEGEIFDTIKVVANDLSGVQSKASASGINFRYLEDGLTISVDETVSEQDLKDIAACFGAIIELGAGERGISLPRQSSYLTHPLFNTHHSETSMMRYMRALADRDLALDRTMIPLGSCTMKLNAVAEMLPITWPEFANLHPFAPTAQSLGSRELIEQLSNWLLAITGYDAVSLQPNAGSQGEFAGLLAIRNYLDSLGQHERTICLIPSSAHGTNAASAVMAGMKVVVVACDEQGNVSLSDLREKIAASGEKLACLMVTYPSTHGVFESEISEIAAAVHDGGGQVYVDGANLNALVGLAQPGKFGADVSHLNLHKTFAIPHGGGGPGVGPVISRAHLAPFLPNHPLDELAGPKTGPGPVSAAPFGSAGVLPISWMYIRMMGGFGLTKATSVAILSANYLAKKLDQHYPVLYRGESGFVAHECILDLRELTKISGITVDDVAKRLMDHGFHAPTMSFPVPGTLMVEPTESEDLAELERFIAAMTSIRGEIQAVIDGEIAAEDSPLRHAPHTDVAVSGDDWNRPYSRSVGGFPSGSSHQIGRTGKYWPGVGRIDGAHGDRNLICSCPPVEEFAN